MDMELDVFNPVAKRIQERADSLNTIGSFIRCGIEGWFKVEVVAALGKSVKALQNKGCDILMVSGDQVELKAATDLNPQYIRNGALEYRTPCLFLGDGSNSARIAQLSDFEVKLLAYKIFSDGAKDWIIGLIVPEIWYGLDQTKYQIDNVLSNQNASPEVSLRLRSIHADFMKSLGPHCVARTHKFGITYFLINAKSEERAFVYLDVRRNHLAVKFFTGGSSIDGLSKGNWHHEGDSCGSESLKVNSNKSQGHAVEYAVAAKRIAEMIS